MVIVVVCILFQQATIAFAAATVVSHQSAARELFYALEHRNKEALRAGCREFAAKGPDGNAAMFAQLQHNALILCRNGIPAICGNLGQPQRQLNPNRKAKLIAQFKVPVGGDPQAALNSIKSKIGQMLKLLPNACLGRVAVQQIWVPAPAQSHARIIGFAIQKRGIANNRNARRCCGFGRWCVPAYKPHILPYAAMNVTPHIRQEASRGAGCWQAVSTRFDYRYG